MNSQLALQCPKAKMYLPTKAYSELDYHKWPKWTQITKKWVRLSKTIIGVVDTKNVNSIGINEGVIQPSLVWNVTTNWDARAETNIACHNLTSDIDQPKWPWHSSNSNDQNGNGTIPENQMVRPKK